MFFLNFYKKNIKNAFYIYELYGTTLQFFKCSFVNHNLLWKKFTLTTRLNCCTCEIAINIFAAHRMYIFIFFAFTFLSCSKIFTYLLNVKFILNRRTRPTSNPKHPNMSRYCAASCTTSRFTDLPQIQV